MSAGASISMAAVRRDLWMSFVYMVRAYTAARNVAEPSSHLTVDDSRNGQVLVTKPGKLLTMEYDPERGEGCWTVLEGSPLPDTIVDHGPIQLEIDGVMFYNERRLDFDMAALEMLAAFDQGKKAGHRKSQGEQGR